MDKIIIVVDLGHFKAYRVSKNPMESPKTELIKSYDFIDGHGKLRDKLSDVAGRFGAGEGKGSARKGYGEPHNIELETEKRLIKLIVKDINGLIAKEKCAKWYLAAVKSINKQIVGNLAPGVKAKLHKNIAADLTKVARSKILSRFE